MVARLAIVIATLVAASPAFSQAMNADTARRFVVGKLFAFVMHGSCRGHIQAAQNIEERAFAAARWTE